MGPDRNAIAKVSTQYKVDKIRITYKAILIILRAFIAMPFLFSNYC